MAKRARSGGCGLAALYQPRPFRNCRESPRSELGPKSLKGAQPRTALGNHS